MDKSGERLFDKEDLFGRFIIKGGYRKSGSNSISPYVTMVKLKKAINRASDIEMEQVNRTVFGEKLPFKDHQIHKIELVRMLEVEEDGHTMKCLYVAQEIGIVDAMLCLLKKKEFNLDQKILRDYFLNPGELPNLSMDDFEQ
jgi:hypothetical protein